MALGTMVQVEAPKGFANPGKHYYHISNILFEVDVKYVPIKPIGKGSYGVVCSCIDKETDEKVAVKKISNAFDNPIDALRTLRELMLLRHLHHHNIIALKDVMLPPHRTSFRDVYLVYPLMDTDLHSLIRSTLPLSNHHCRYFLFQLLCGLNYLHSGNVLHRDLKPGNLLINGADCQLKICDFGLSRTAATADDSYMTEYVVTRWYRAPELLLLCDNYGKPIDVWSAGCIFAELLGRKPIFPGRHCLDQLKLIVNTLGTEKVSEHAFIDRMRERRFIRSLPYSEGLPFPTLFPDAEPLAIDLLQRMLVFDPTKRISVAEALQHPYMAPLCDPTASPLLCPLIDLEMDKGDGDLATLREMIWREALYYHPEAYESCRIN